MSSLPCDLLTYGKECHLVQWILTLKFLNNIGQTFGKNSQSNFSEEFRSFFIVGSHLKVSEREVSSEFKSLDCLCILYFNLIEKNIMQGQSTYKHIHNWPFCVLSPSKVVLVSVIGMAISILMLHRFWVHRRRRESVWQTDNYCYTFNSLIWNSKYCTQCVTVTIDALSFLSFWKK